MQKAILKIIFLGLISQICCQIILTCIVSNTNVCIFYYATVRRGHKVEIHIRGESATNDIKEVRFVSSSIYAIPAELFVTFKNLENLLMIEQELQEILPNTFKFAKNLYEINLRSNSLKVIEEDIFKGAFNLEVITLGYNQIRSVDKNAFKVVPKLTNLELGANRLTSFDRSTLEGLPGLLDFSLWNNSLVTLHKTTFQNNFKLRKLYLGRNRYNALSNTMFSHLKFLDYLVLRASNCIDKIYSENAFAQMGLIENDLLNCTIGYLSLENDELCEKLDESNNKILTKLDRIESALKIAELKNLLQ
jgi:Leucine-rich repeat (LRR) protein